ncbi:MAG: glycosyltransferase [Candidatus Eisenbacteria bacterium]|uniref:Glycosyltransferase n=1 Tax=Eiseniibacteriota bacterium TaxID=2212470 RepID=A0A538S682_UNCEI|nr:MAG: glycosyltransferase [Candidatus Eisenbacteria bacterium]
MGAGNAGPNTEPRFQRPPTHTEVTLTRPSRSTYGNDDLTVVIQHFGSYDLLRRCLRELSPSHLATIVVEDGCYEKKIRDDFPTVRFVTLSRNSGFAAACNRGLAAVDTACVAFLNNDVFVTPNWQTPLLDALARDEDVAICQPKLLSAKNAGYFDYAGAAGGLIDRYGYPFCRGRIFDETTPRPGKEDRLRPGLEDLPRRKRDLGFDGGSEGLSAPSQQHHRPSEKLPSIGFGPRLGGALFSRTCLGGVLLRRRPSGSRRRGSEGARLEPLALSGHAA